MADKKQAPKAQQSAEGSCQRRKEVTKEHTERSALIYSAGLFQ